MASISSIGVGSGLPLSELLDKLRSAEELPLQHLQTRHASYQTRLSAYSTLKSAVTGLDTALQGLAKADTFGAMKATSGDAATLAVSVSSANRAVEGSYTIDIVGLASNQSLATTGHNDRTSQIGAGGTVQITINGETHDIALEGDTSLEGVRQAVNKAGIGVTASIINNGGDTNAHQLVFSTTTTGVKASVEGIAVTGNESLHEALAYGSGLRGDEAFAPSVVETVAARNAQIKVNGIVIESQTNTIEDAIEGIKLTLNATTPNDKPVTVDVAKNTAPATTAVQNFVSAYNALHNTIKSLTSYNVETQQASSLTGDSVARMVQTQARQMLNIAVEGDVGMLSQLGISVQLDGTLEVDTEKLASALSEQPEAVAAFFSGAEGYVAKAKTVTQAMLSPTGLIENASSGTQKTLADLNDQFERTQQRIDETMARYQAQFVALDGLISQMNSTSAYLTQQLDMLSAMAKGSNK